MLFDFDGVIANTIDYHVAAWTQAFAEYGVEITPQDIYFQEGQTAYSIAPNLARSKGLNLSAEKLDQITQKKRAIYQKITRARVYPETIELVKLLRQYPLKLAIVTGSVMKNIEIVTGKEFVRQFDCIVTGDTVERNKPFPDPYLKAAEELALQPQQCVVIENAPLGIQAAKAAGMFCIAVQTTIPDKSILKQADVIYPHLSDIPIDVIVNQRN